MWLRFVTCFRQCPHYGKDYRYVKGTGQVCESKRKENNNKKQTNKTPLYFKLFIKN